VAPVGLVPEPVALVNSAHNLATHQFEIAADARAFEAQASDRDPGAVTAYNI